MYTLSKKILSPCVIIMSMMSLIHALPTIYKYNNNKVLEADLIPVSSTVIPLPVYQVGYGFQIVPSLKDDKTKRPEGPITLVTVHTKTTNKKVSGKGDKKE